MENEIEMNAKIFKVLSDPKRLSIIDMLSCDELCACKILEKFHITQPTLSHDMKLLCETGLVNSRKEGKWMFYSLNQNKVESLIDFIKKITSDKPDCICKT